MDLTDIEASRGTAQTSEFESISIFDALGRIGSQTRPLYLPAIQRHFVWDRNQICNLFDSMMRGYPIGTFLFWEVEDEKRNDYAFYEFIRDYSEHAAECCNRTAPISPPPNLTGVLDGQQRLNSMFVALLGSYSAFIGGQGNHRSKKESFPKRRFHLNVFFEPGEADNVIYQFRFLAEWETSTERFDGQHCWFPVHFIYHCESAKEVEQAWHRFAEKFAGNFLPMPGQVDRAIKMLELLRRRVREEKLVTYFPIRKRDLTEALDIFVRANNGGTSISNPQMIFSTIIAHWPEGREKIEAFRYNFNQIGNGFQLDITHIMLACLALSGCPVRLRIESFKPAHVETISDEWDRITCELREAAQMLHNWGLSGNNAVTPHAIIALAIFLRAGIRADSSKEQLRLFVLKSLLCELYRRPERSLELIRKFADFHLRQADDFDLGHFESAFELPSGQRMEVSSETLESLLMLPISDPRTYVLLSLLHPQHALHQHAFQKDHIHPNSGFADLGPFGLGQERTSKWYDWKDRLPNIQLLQEGENNEKRAKPFKDWLPVYRPHDEERKVYLAQNDIPAGVSLDFADFEKFFVERKERLRQRLTNLLHVTTQLPPVTASRPAPVESQHNVKLNESLNRLDSNGA